MEELKPCPQCFAPTKEVSGTTAGKEWTMRIYAADNTRPSDSGDVDKLVETAVSEAIEEFYKHQRAHIELGGKVDDMRNTDEKIDEKVKNFMAHRALSELR